MTPYQKSLYQHPLWQKKRLEVLDKADWRCVCCGSKDDQLHAHHLFYRKGAKPWEYEEGEIISLCDDCHEREHEFGDSSWEDLKRHLVAAGCLHGVASLLVDGFGSTKLTRQEWFALSRCIRVLFERRDRGTDLSDLAREIEEGDRDPARDDDGYDAWVEAGMPSEQQQRVPVSSDGNPF